jgi:uncharacterized membrane protein YagU involved in acid resistance
MDCSRANFTFLPHTKTSSCLLHNILKAFNGLVGEIVMCFVNQEVDAIRIWRFLRYVIFSWYYKAPKWVKSETSLRKNIRTSIPVYVNKSESLVHLATCRSLNLCKYDLGLTAHKTMYCWESEFKISFSVLSFVINLPSSLLHTIWVHKAVEGMAYNWNSHKVTWVAIIKKWRWSAMFEPITAHRFPKKLFHFLNTTIDVC